MRPKLGDLNFGHVYAANEVRERDDFEKYFYDLNSITDSIKNDKLINVVLGRKGTGKTLLAHCLAKSLTTERHISSVESLQDIEFHELYHYGTDEVSSKKYSQLFRWMLLINVSKTLIKHRNAFSEERHEAVDVLDHFLKCFGFNMRQLRPQKIVEKTTTFSKKASAGFFRIISLGSDDVESAKEEKRTYIDCIEELEDFIVNLLVDSDVRFTVFYDDLDIRFENSDAYKDGILSYLSAASELNYRFIDEKIESKIVTLFRADIFDVLSAPNLNQILEGNAIRLNWDAHCTSETEIFPMVIHKIKPYLKGKLKSKEPDIIFDEMVDDKICNEPSRAYILHRSLGRPRDVIKMLSLVSNRYPACDKFNSHLFNTVENEYSKYLLKEVKNEMIGHFNQAQIDFIFSVITRIQKRCFTKYAILGFFDDEMLTEYKLTVDRVLHGLFKVGAICHLKKNSVQGGRDQRYHSYLTEDYQLLIDDSTQFEIHVGLWNVLQIKPPKNRFH
ncbi:hypothetical protein AB4138_17970 [Vibrio sp. 10N.286.52.C3]|uniref:P-loop ATPase, Sll1717 family n=1 Tax=Vibrio sp. 10N.286.52.C3 TaxID=3229713 RepID=UPI00354C5AE2